MNSECKTAYSPMTAKYAHNEIGGAIFNLLIHLLANEEKNGSFYRRINMTVA